MCYAGQFVALPCCLIGVIGTDTYEESLFSSIDWTEEDYEFTRMVEEDQNNEAQSYRCVSHTAEAGSRERKRAKMEMGGIIIESFYTILTKMMYGCRARRSGAERGYSYDL